MGTDIHITVEVKNEQGIWEDKTLFPVDPGEGEEKPFIGNYGEDRHHCDPGRNYWLFGFLAKGVRGNPNLPTMGEPRGVPDDASEMYRAWVDQYDGDGHSHSWFTIKELMAVDWNQKIPHTGTVNATQYAVARINGKPDAWSEHPWGGNNQILSPEAMEQAIFLATGETSFHRALRDHRNTLDTLPAHTDVSWTGTLAECLPSFLLRQMPHYWSYGDPENVRICFFFDN